MQVAGACMKTVDGPASCLSCEIIGIRRRKAAAALRSCVAAAGLLTLGFASSEPAHAFDAISLAGVNAAFETAAPAKTSRVSMQGDAALAALREFVQGLPSSQAATVSAAKADDYADLRAYAHDLGFDQ